MPCVKHLGEVAAGYHRLQGAGWEVVAVAQAVPAMLTRFLARHPLPFPLLGDPTREAYRAFGLERLPWRGFFRPRVLANYLRLMLTGSRLEMPYPGEDVRQLGGDFLLDRAGRVVFAFRSSDPTARPSVEQLLVEVRSS